MGAKLLLLLVLAALLVAGTSAQACSYGGLSETYYANVNLQPPAVLTRFGYPRYNWGFGSPATGIVPPNNFSLYIAGQITPPETGTYRFRPYSDDGLRLYINGVLTCEAWSQRSYNVVPCTRNWNLVAGVPFDVVITYFEILETARFDLNWILPSNAGTLTITAPANSSYGFSNCTTKELLVTTPVQVSNEVASLQIKLSSKPNLNVTVTAESTCMNFDACLVNIINNNFNLTHTLRGLFKDANQQCCNVTLKATEGDADYLGQTKTVQVCKGASNPSSAISFGDPHMTTFDGAKYDTFALGEFYFVRKIEGDFAVQTRQARCGRASCNSGVAVRYRNTTFYVYLNDFVSSTPQVVTVNNPADGVSITDLGNKFIFTTPLGITVNVVVDKWHGRNSFYLNVKVTAGSAFYNHLYGLAGKFDGTSSNDMTRPDGQLAVSTSNFVTSWAIGTASENLFTSPTAVIPALYPGGVPIVTNASFTPACCGNCSVPVPPAVCTSNCSIPQCTSCVCTSDCEPDCTVFSTQAFKDQATASCNQFFNNDAAKCCAPLLSNATYLATCMCDYNLAQGTGFEKASLDAYLAECEVIRTRLNYVCPTCECDACAPAPCTPEPPVVVTVGPISISRSCPAAYSPLTVQGSGFPKTGSVQCSFNGGSPTTATVVTAYKLTCPLPASIPAGTESLVVRVVVNGVASNSSAIVSFVTTCCDAPCKNGATCVPNGLEDYTCNCVAPYSGKNCDAQCAINPTPNITFTTGQVNKTIQVVLSAAPGAPVTVSLTSDCVNLEKCALVFTTSNWNVPQTVQVSLNAANAAAVCAINLVSNSTGLCGNKTASTLITKGQLERAQANAYGDPHITGYDRVTLDFFGKGDYTLTRTLAGEYAIQVRNEACGAGSCIYKAAVKFYDVVYTIQITSAGVPSAQLVGVPSARGVVITNPTPKVFMMDTTTGITTKVNVGSYLFKGKDTYYLSVSVKLPSSYAGLMAGQFGNFDGNKNNELTLPNGQAAPTESSFHLSWAVPSAENLILNPYATVSPIRGAVVPTLSSSASCFQPPNPDPLPPAPNVINCTATPNDPACKPIVPDAGPTCSSPNATQLAQAKAACDPLFNSTDAQCCHNNGYPGDSYYSSCLCDMILTGEPSFALVDYLTYIEACKQDLANRKITACKPCPNSCSGVGTCSNGVCQCPPNYEGEDCSINFNEPPVPETPSPLSVGKGCGETLTVYGSKFFGTDLKCLFDGSVQVAATKVSDYELRCTVPSFGPAVTQVSVHVIRRAVTSTASVTLSLHASCCSSPCQNGATCVGGNGPSVSCTCAPGFGGTNCEFSACPKTASRNGTLGPVPLSTSGNVHCPPGHVLKALTTCSGTTFGTYKVTCAPVTSFCSESIFSHAVFPKTPAGEPSMGTCEAGFVGTPVRNCLHNGNWGSTIFSGCQPLTCSADSSDAGIFAQTQASVTASGTCGAGFTGAPTRQCLIDGTWGPIVNPCTVLLTCSSDTYGTATFPATNGGLIATGQCAAGFEGTPKRECKVDGTWSANVQNPCTRIVCPLLDSASTTYDATFAGDLKAGTCKAGYAGAPMRQCNLDGSWSAETGTACVIVPPTCAGATYGSATFPTTLSGTYATGTCAAGFAGTPKRECLANGQWSSTVQNLCQRTTCPPLDDGFATYGALPTGSLHTGTCKAGFAGSPIRECLVNGNLEGTWGAVKNQCQAAVSQCPAVSGTSFYANANWAATPAGQYATGTCKAGYSGAPKRLCQETGSWSGNVLNHCQRLSCPGVTFENAVYVTTLTSEFRVGTCEAGFSGSPSRYCQADQTWSAPKGTPCTPVVAP